jgi:hypothetical protein
MIENDKNGPDALREVCCRICALKGIDIRMEAKRLSGHIGGKHYREGWSKDKYVEQFGADGESDFWHPVKVESERKERSNYFSELNHNRAAKNKAVREQGVAAAFENLENEQLWTDEERTFREEFVESVLQQIDRDETQIPIIGSLATDMVYLKRLREHQLRLSKPSRNANKDTKLILDKDFETVVKQTEDRIQKSMTALGISREAQMKRGQVLKSTPASLISAYVDEIERMSPEMLDALRLEEQRVYAKMQKRISDHILQYAPDLEEEEESDDVSSGTVLNFEQALLRAGIAVGGASTQRQAPQPVPEPAPVVDGDFPF